MYFRIHLLLLFIFIFIFSLGLSDRVLKGVEFIYIVLTCDNLNGLNKKAMD